MDFPLERGHCHVCGRTGDFIHKTNSARTGYRCSHCSASLRYRHQAKVIVEAFSDGQYESFAKFSRSLTCKNLDIYEPGIIGPFRKYLRRHPNYQQSSFLPDSSSEKQRAEVRCENLESLTFDDNSFDLVISSDIMEHVRKPYDAFAEIYRILRPGGCHVFTIPLSWPPTRRTVKRIDVDGKDAFLMPPVYHGSPMKNCSNLVYNDFGEDLIATLGCLGYVTEVTGLSCNRTFLTRKPS